MSTNKKICELLLEDNIITRDEMDKAVSLQKEEGGKIGSILIRLGLIDNKTLIKYLDKQLEQLGK